MKPREAKLSHAELTRLLDYDPATGIFRWKVDRGSHTKAGAIAGCLNRGYVQLCIRKMLFAAHRVAWFYVHGVWPKDELDHENIVRNDNRLDNLREVTSTENNRNVGMRKSNKVGLKGVCRHHRKFTAYITVEYKTHYLGLFDTPEEAHAAYTAASQLHHGAHWSSI